MPGVWKTLSWNWINSFSWLRLYISRSSLWSAVSEKLPASALVPLWAAGCPPFLTEPFICKGYSQSENTFVLQQLGYLFAALHVSTGLDDGHELGAALEHRSIGTWLCSMAARSISRLTVWLWLAICAYIFSNHIFYIPLKNVALCGSCSFKCPDKARGCRQRPVHWQAMNFVSTHRQQAKYYRFGCGNEWKYFFRWVMIGMLHFW